MITSISGSGSRDLCGAFVDACLVRCIGGVIALEMDPPNRGLLFIVDIV
jgi:hypothetical protein